MLNLYVMRHSKSSWNVANIIDFERPLSSKGKKDIKFIIKFLKNKKTKFSHFEDLLLVKFYQMFGSDWERISENFKKIIQNHKYMYICVSFHV